MPSFWPSGRWPRIRRPLPRPRCVTVIRAGALIDGVSALRAATRSSSFAATASRASATRPRPRSRGHASIDLSHATVLPGLIDAHTHIFLQGEDPAEGGYDVNS